LRNFRLTRESVTGLALGATEEGTRLLIKIVMADRQWQLAVVT
jgi:hypothetical protein